MQQHSKKDFHIFYGTNFLTCDIRKAKNFVQELVINFPVPILVHSSSGWLPSSAFKLIWENTSPDRVIDLFKVSEYDSYDILKKSIIYFLSHTNKGRELTINLCSSNIPYELGNNIIHAELAKSIIFKIDLEIFRTKHNGESSITRIYPLADIFTKGYKDVHILASISCRTKWVLEHGELLDGVTTTEAEKLKTNYSHGILSSFKVVSASAKIDSDWMPSIPHLPTQYQEPLSFHVEKKVKEDPKPLFTNLSNSHQLKLF